MQIPDRNTASYQKEWKLPCGPMQSDVELDDLDDKWIRKQCNRTKTVADELMSQFSFFRYYRFLPIMS